MPKKIEIKRFQISNQLKLSAWITQIPRDTRVTICHCRLLKWLKLFAHIAIVALPFAILLVVNIFFLFTFTFSIRFPIIPLLIQLQ